MIILPLLAALGMNISNMKPIIVIKIHKYSGIDILLKAFDTASLEKGCFPELYISIQETMRQIPAITITILSKML